MILAHQIEIMARQKSLKSVDHYLSTPAKTKKEAGASAMLAMVRRFKERQEARV